MYKTMLKNDTYETECGFNGNSIGDLCRNIIDSGAADDGMEVYRGDMKVMEVKSIANAAKWVIREEPHLHYAKYQKFEKWPAKEKETANVLQSEAF